MFVRPVEEAGEPSKTESSDSFAFGKRAGVIGAKPSNRDGEGIPVNGGAIPVAHSCHTATSKSKDSDVYTQDPAVSASSRAPPACVQVVFIATEPSSTAG